MAVNQKKQFSLHSISAFILGLLVPKQTFTLHYITLEIYVNADIFLTLSSSAAAVWVAGDAKGHLLSFATD